MAGYTPTFRKAVEAKILAEPESAYASDARTLLDAIDHLSRKRDQSFNCSQRDMKRRDDTMKRLKATKRIFKEVEDRLKGV